MSDIWDIYEELVDTRNVLENTPVEGSTGMLNDAIDEAVKRLQSSLPKLGRIITEWENE